MTVLEPRMLFVLETSCETVALFMSIIRDWERGCVAGDVGLPEEGVLGGELNAELEQTPGAASRGRWRGRLGYCSTVHRGLGKPFLR
jgi:hypothetical protein